MTSSTGSFLTIVGFIKSFLELIISGSIFFPKNIFYYSTDLEKFWYEEVLLEFKPKNLITIKNFPLHYGFKNQKPKKNISKNLIDLFNFDYFDLIIEENTNFFAL